MIRTKTFDATGIAPGGRLFAGDLNAIEDAAAGLTDLTQNLQVGTVALGESGLQLLRYGTGEARLSGLFRTDGLIRGLGGLLPGTFTTTQRDDGVSLPLGKRPYGLAILNTTTNQWEWNKGTDVTPAWQAIGGTPSTSGLLSAIPAAASVVAGAFYYATDQDVLYRSTGAAWVRIGSQAGDLFLTLNAAASTGRVLLQGQTIARAGVNADLFAKWGTTYNTGGEAGTDFRLPDLRGRMPVALGSHADVNAIGLTEGVAVAANRRPKHRTSNALSHNLTLPNHTHTVVGWDTNASLNNGLANTTAAGTSVGHPSNNPDTLPAINGSITGSIGTNNANDALDAPAYFVVNVEAKL